MSDSVRAALPGRLTSARLDNGLTIHAVENSDSPVVTTALTYGTGASRDPVGLEGAAHFLEHMMFKGSAGFAPGEIDGRTLALGGSNNAFTTHDSTTYYFSFGARYWQEALEIEVDRMRALTLDTDEVENERSVILDELAMYEAEPWDALERQVLASLFGCHAYGRPIIGDRDGVGAITAADLSEFHRLHYHPANATLVVTGAIGTSAIDRVAARFETVPGPAEQGELAPLSQPRPLSGSTRLEVERGRISRFLIAFPAPAAPHPDLASLRVLCGLLSTGRSSRLQAELVEHRGWCGWVSASLSEGRAGGSVQIAGELTPGADAGGVERVVLEALRRLREEEIEAAELERAKRLIEADWVFAHERIEAQALTLSQAAATVSPSYPGEQLVALAAVRAGDLSRSARSYLDLDAGAVVGWGHPETSLQERESS